MTPSPPSLHRCERCGASAEAPADGMPLGWSLTSEAGATSLLCGGCTRIHARDIEAKLDETWWSSDPG